MKSAQTVEMQNYKDNRIKVVMIYRKYNPTAVSIEMLFDALIEHLRIKIELIKFELHGKVNILSDAYQLRKLNADVYHVTGDVHYITLLLPKHKTVLTIHDINHYLKDLYGWKKVIYKWFWILLPIMFAQNVTVISQETKRELDSMSFIKDKKKIIINNCYSNIFSYSPKVFNKNKPVILQIGTAPHKNIARLLAAVQNIHCKLIIIGYLDDSSKEFIRRHQIDYENLYCVPFEIIKQKYLESDIVSFVSLREGFGMPIIEAQIVGRALITSDIEPMKHIAGNGAVLVNPYSEQEIRDSIMKIINDDDFRAGLIEKGVINVRRFAPEITAEKYFQIYSFLTNKKFIQ